MVIPEEEPPTGHPCDPPPEPANVLDEAEQEA